MSRLVDQRSPWATRIAPKDIINMTITDVNNPFNRFTLLLSNRDIIIQWLQKVGLLAVDVRCEKCNVDCKLSVRDRAIDGYTWRCPARHETTIRRFSFFAKSHLHIPDIINFVITYAEGQSLWKCAQAAGVGYGSTAVDWGNFCRDLFVEYYVRQIRDEQFYGEVEVDESLFGRRTKYHKGDPRGMKVWIFGIVERTTNRLKVYPVETRDADTLMGVIKDNVATGSTIYTDGWSAYSGLQAAGFNHYVIEHKKAFSRECRDQATGQLITVHTNRIEGCWKHAKDYFRRMNGTKISQFEGHLCELMWRWWDRRPKPEAILCLIKEYYTLDAPPQFTAANPVFSTWSRHPTDSPDDSMSRWDTDDDERDAGDDVQNTATATQSSTSTELTTTTATTSTSTCTQQSSEPQVTTTTTTAPQPKKTNRLALIKNLRKVN